MTIIQLKYAIKLSEIKSFSRVSQQLFITQPTLSEQIKKLEEELGTDLFVRNRKRIELTPAGIEFVEYARKVVFYFDQLSNAVGKYCDLLKGTLRIGLLWSFGYTQISDVIRKFTLDYPGINVEYYIDGSNSLVQKLKDRELDVAFITGYEREISMSQLQIKLFSSSKMFALVNCSHPYAQLKEISFSDLNNQSILMVSQSSNLYPEFKKLFDLYVHDAHIVGYNSQTDVCYQVAQNNLALSFTSEEAFSSFPSNAEVKAIKLINPSINRNIYYATNNEANKSNIIKMFETYLNQFCS